MPSIKVGSEVVVASSVVFVLLMLVVPLPGFVLDMLLATNIAVSLAVLLTAFYANRPLEFAIFPGLLLMTTLFRLSLNVASTRLILSEGKAGALIAAFGDFVVAGNYVVGGIVFLVLVLINFVVITKGSGRIAEVGARFTLDALPGKQMAIDADLNAGLIGEAEAKQRRVDVSREADFYGAMDGASKFVRGDAMAGLIITAINIVGGLVIGASQLGMTVGEAAETFTLLSIGDGLVSQIPSLLISTAAGIIVSRASGDGNIAGELTSQLFTKSQPILLTGGFLALLGLMPGLPVLPFWGLAGLTLYLGRTRQRQEQHREAEAEREALLAAEADGAPAETTPADLLLVDPLALEIGYSLISIVDPNQDGDLLDRVKVLREQLAVELGVVIPPVRIRDNAGLGANAYVVKLRGNAVAEGEVMPGYGLALLPDPDAPAPPGIRCEDPTFGLPAVWVAERNLHEAERLGLTVIEAPAVITTHLLEVLRKHAHKLLDRQETKKLVDKVKETAPALVEELVPNVLSVGGVQKVLKRLLMERVPVRDLVTILEALADHAPQTKNLDVLTESVRAALAPTITREMMAGGGSVHCVVLDPVLEQHLLEQAEAGKLNPNTLGLDPARAEKFVAEADRLARRMIGQGHPPILLTSPVLRAALFGFLSPMLTDVTVLSYNDLVPEAAVDVDEQLKLV
jgi:flagellar biosynthesis protein FlhA